VYFVQFRFWCLTSHRDKKVVGVFCAFFRAPLHGGRGRRYTLPKKFPFPLKSAGDFVVILPMNTGALPEITSTLEMRNFHEEGKHVASDG
jgi:hypothetical protein